MPHSAKQVPNKLILINIYYTRLIIAKRKEREQKKQKEELKSEKRVACKLKKDIFQRERETGQLVKWINELSNFSCHL